MNRRDELVVIFMPKPIPDGPRVVAGVGERLAAGVAENVGADVRHSHALTDTLAVAVDGVGRERPPRSVAKTDVEPGKLASQFAPRADPKSRPRISSPGPASEV